MLATLVAAACALDRPVNEGSPIGFIGEVQSVEFAEDWTSTGGLGIGDPRSPVLVGPQTVSLTSGETLEISAGTPVPRFESNPDWSVPCVIMGQLTDDGIVAWFQVLEVRSIEGVSLADVGGVAQTDTRQETVTTDDGIEFPLLAESTDCGLPLDEVAGLRAVPDWTTGPVVALICVFDG